MAGFKNGKSLGMDMGDTARQLQAANAAPDPEPESEPEPDAINDDDDLGVVVPAAELPVKPGDKRSWPVFFRCFEHVVDEDDGPEQRHASELQDSGGGGGMLARTKSRATGRQLAADLIDEGEEWLRKAPDQTLRIVLGRVDTGHQGAGDDMSEDGLAETWQKALSSVRANMQDFRLFLTVDRGYNLPIMDIGASDPYVQMWYSDAPPKADGSAQPEPSEHQYPMTNSAFGLRQTADMVRGQLASPPIVGRRRLCIVLAPTCS
jgi:hypothetical protein